MSTFFLVLSSLLFKRLQGSGLSQWHNVSNMHVWDMVGYSGGFGLIATVRMCQLYSLKLGYEILVKN